MTAKMSFTLPFMAILLIAFSVCATEIPGGYVSGNWYSSGNPYNINGEITIHADSTLNIHEGVGVIFQGTYCFYVHGILEAEGTRTDPILFTAAGGVEFWRGIRIIDALSPSYLSYCILQNGRATGWEMSHGGAIHCNNSDLVISHCVIWNNDSWVSGGGLYFHQSSSIVDKCTIYDNFADNGGGGIYCTESASSTTITDCILWENDGGQIGGNPQVSYCNVEDGWSGIGIIDFEPMFVNAAEGDFHLQCGSPCIDMGDPIPLNNDPDSTRADMGVFYYHHTFQLCPNILDFGIVLMSAPLELPLTITNINDTTLVLYDFVTSHPDFYTDFNPADSLLHQGDSLLVNVTFHPTSTAPYDDILTIANSSEDWIVHLLGTGIADGTLVEGGSVSGNWSISGSPYLIAGDIDILPGDTLCVGPGVEVCFIDPYKLTICGFLEAIGSETDSINFTTMYPDEGWGGLHFVDVTDTCHLSYCIVQYGQATGEEDYGGGIYCENSNLVIEDCSIRLNQAEERGGGIHSVNSNLVIESCLINLNRSVGSGGGINCEYSDATIENCIFEGNESVNFDGGGINLVCTNAAIHFCILKENSVGEFGGGIKIHDIYVASNVVIEDCNIIENTSVYNGGGIYCGMLSNPTIYNCLVQDNYTDWHGGGISCYYSDPTINNCTIQDNYAGHDGGGVISENYSNPTLSNCVIAGNTAVSTGGGFMGGGILQNCTVYGNSAGSIGGLSEIDTASNCIIWNNSPDQVDSSSIVIYSDVMNGWPGSGNIDEDPLFYATTGDSAFYLTENSPCIDTGDPASPLDPDGTRADMGAYYYDQTTGIKELPYSELPTSYRLHNPYPNPFNPTTTISFDLPVASLVKLNVYDIHGRRVGVGLAPTRPYSPGHHQITFDGTGLSSGIYFYRLEAGDFTATKKMILMK